MKRFLIMLTILAVSSAMVFAAGKGKAKKADTDEFVHVECGGFRMGSEDEYNATPHDAWVSEFFICTHEVTQEEYKAIMGTNPSEIKKKNHPVENVSWFDAIEYCNRRSIAEGFTPCYTEDFELDIGANGYRLPTEAEWELAARGGNLSQNYFFSGSDYLDSVSWNSENSGHKHHEIMTKKPNELGIYDMTGNVAEWCWDWYDSYPEEKQDIDPEGPASGEFRVIRGGACYFIDDNMAIQARNGSRPDTKTSYFGFRIVRSGPRG